jgi:ankyrin repeat protein
LRLISQGADVNATEADGATPLHLAAEREDVDVVRALLQRGANVNAANRYGVMLTVAAATGNGLS